MRPKNRISQREYFSYYGATCIGRLLVDEETGKASAFDEVGRSLGEFPNYDGARKAVSQAHHDTVERNASTAAALKRLTEPVGFASGLPSDVGGGRRR